MRTLVPRRHGPDFIITNHFFNYRVTKKQIFHFFLKGDPFTERIMGTDIQTLTTCKYDHILKSEKEVRTNNEDLKDMGYDCMAMYLNTYCFNIRNIIVHQNTTFPLMRRNISLKQ